MGFATRGRFRRSGGEKYPAYLEVSRDGRRLTSDQLKMLRDKLRNLSLKRQRLPTKPIYHDV